MSLAARTSFAWFFSLLPVLGFSACSAKDTSVDSHTSGSANGTAGTQSVVGASGSGGLAGKSATGSAGSSNAGGALAQGGFSANAGSGSASVNVAGSANGGGSGNVGLGGNPGGSGSSAGSQSSSAGSAGSAGLGNVAGAAGSSAAFTQVSTILQKNCGLKGCHADKQSPHFVPGAMLYATLTGPNTVIASCDYTKLVEAGDPSKSALVRLMNKKCGNFVMPPGCNQATCLPAADLKTLSDWIQAGAPP